MNCDLVIASFAEELTMPNFFVCEAGPMGGISIIFVGDTARACLDFVDFP